MKDPTSVQTTSRDEMICPACYTEGLEEHKAFSGDYSGKAEILKATRCPNEECRYHSGFPPEVLEEQYHDLSTIEKLLGKGGSSSDGDGSSGFNVGSLILNGLIVVGVLVMAASFLGVDIAGFLGGSGGEGDIYGQVYGVDGEPAQGVTVEIDNTSYNATTNESGMFVLENVSYGEYSVVAYPQNESSAGIVEQRVSVSDSGFNMTNNGSVAVQMIENDTVLGMQFVSVEQTTQERTISGGQQVQIPLISPKNLGGNGLNVTVIPLQDTQNTGSSSVGMDESTVVVPEGTVNQAELEVVGEVSQQEFDGSYTYTGSSQSVQVYGNLEPSSFAVELDSGAGTPTFTERAEVGGGNIMTIDVSGEQSVGTATITLSGGQSTAPNTEEGVYSGTNPSVSIDAESAPSTATLTLTGAVDSQSRSADGTLSGSQLTTSFDGNIPAKNIEVSFNGGTPTNSAVDENTISASGEGGDEIEQYTLIRDAENTTYRLEMNHSVEQNSNLVRAGYTINGQRTEISPGEETVEINASSGDTIVLWVEAQQEDVPTSDYTHGGQFEVTSSEVSETQIQPGDSVGVRATINNPSSSRLTETIKIFRDGQQVQSQRVTLNGGESEQITFDRVSFNSEGIHTVEVSDDNPIQVQVGSASLSYGVGSIYGKLTRLGSSGTVMMDTTGDGSYDCQVSAAGGSCSIGSASSGQQSFAINQEGVTETSYTLTYDARFGAKGITVDMDDDGQDEISHPGVLGQDETVEQRVTLEAGTYEIDFNVENGGEVPYELQWTEAGVVNQPEVTVNGETVIDESESFKGERSYEIGSLPGGENTLRFSSESGNTYIAEVTWSEQSDETIPRLLIDGTVACEKDDFRGDNRCTVPTSLVESGQVEFTFEGGASQFQYSVQQTARAAPTQVTATVNGETIQIVRSEAVSTSESGEWTARRTISNVIETGNNSVKLSTQQVNGMPVESSGSVSYTYDINQARNPHLILTNANGEQRFNVSDSALDANGYLQSETQVTIPESALVSGDNALTVASDNNGGVTVRIVSVNESISTSAFSGSSNSSNSSTEGVDNSSESGS